MTEAELAAAPAEATAPATPGGRRPRRTWTASERAAIMAEANAPGAVLAQVAKAHGIAPAVIYDWKRKERGGADSDPGGNGLDGGATAAVQETVPSGTQTVLPVSNGTQSPLESGTPASSPEASFMELELRGVLVRIPASREMVAAVVNALLEHAA